MSNLNTTNKYNQSLKFQGKVLLVEDDKASQLVAGFLISELGVTYDIANDGKEALEFISRGEQYDLILMDFQMPVMDGFIATKSIRALNKSVQIICGLSASNSTDDKNKAKKAGMNDYLSKPLDVPKLEKLFIKYLR